MLRRKRTAWVAAVWLSCQAIALVLPLSAQAAAAVQEDPCTCPGHLPGAPCPMHHHGSGASATDQNAPVVRNACAPPDVALLALAGGLGILTRPTTIPADHDLTTAPSFTSIPVHRPEIPDAPPPRA